MTNKNQQQLQVSIEELAMILFERDIQIANLRKALKEAQQEISAQAELLGKSYTPPVMAEKEQ